MRESLREKSFALKQTIKHHHIPINYKVNRNINKFGKLLADQFSLSNLPNL